MVSAPAPARMALLIVSAFTKLAVPVTVKFVVRLIFALLTRLEMTTCAPATVMVELTNAVPMHTLSLGPGSMSVSQFPAVFHRLFPAAPVQLMLPEQLAWPSSLRPAIIATTPPAVSDGAADAVELSPKCLSVAASGTAGLAFGKSDEVVAPPR